VDPAAGSPPDRIFVINIWGHPIDSLRYSNAVALNGRSWPHTERIAAVVGDTMQWRVVNASGRGHPMHLHGAYFRVDSKGSAVSDTIYTERQRRLAVTEEMRAYHTMQIAWAPVRPGRWVFHCHITFHVIPTNARVVPAEHGSHDVSSVDPAEHMAGLVIGIDARMPAGQKEAARHAPRRLDLFVQEGPRRGRADRTLSFVLQRGKSRPAPDSTEIPGTLLVLTRDQPTDVVVHNRLKEPTAVHWHGLELESYSDGVAGWGGTAAMPTPPIMPGKRFTARLSLPRAGTFIYHTHLNDQEQLSSGMYGPLVVLEPGQTFDPRTDHVHIVGWDSYGENVHALVNGDSVSSPPIEMRVGETHRFRFINIGAAARAFFQLTRDSTVAEWRALAKDGATLSAAQQVHGKAQLRIDVGETYDFEFTASSAGEYRLSTPTGPKGEQWERKIIVR
jgi:manganese oxidase